MLRPEDRPLDVGVVPLTIPNGLAIPAQGVNLGGLALCGIRMPAAWTAAALTFQTSYDDGGTWLDLYDVNGEVSVPAGASRHIAIELARFVGLGGMLKVRSGTAGAPVNQGADRALQLIIRAL